MTAMNDDHLSRKRGKETGRLEGCGMQLKRQREKK